MKSAPPVTAIRYTMPRMANVSSAPTVAMSAVAMGAVIRAPAPNPVTATPVIIPRLSGNHLTSVATGTMYPSPRPTPPITPYEQ